MEARSVEAIIKALNDAGVRYLVAGAGARDGGVGEYLKLDDAPLAALYPLERRLAAESRYTGAIR